MPVAEKRRPTPGSGKEYRNDEVNFNPSFSAMLSIAFAESKFGLYWGGLKYQAIALDSRLMRPIKWNASVHSRISVPPGLSMDTILATTSDGEGTCARTPTQITRSKVPSSNGASMKL